MDSQRPASPSQQQSSASSWASPTTTFSQGALASTAGPMRVVSPNAEYVDPTTKTPHLISYPRSARERLQMEEEMVADPSRLPYTDNDDHRTSLELQQQMLSQQFAAEHVDTSGGHASLEIDEEEHDVVEHKFPVRSAIVAGFLLLVGIACLIIGLVHLISGTGGSVFSFVLIGGILVIPGGYQSYIIYNAWRRKPGFSFSQLAAYEGR